MQLMIMLVVFLLAIDDQVGTKILRAPLVSCTLIGLLLNDVATGITIGATSQLFYTVLQQGYVGSSLFSAIVTIVAILGGDSNAVNSVGVYLIALIYGLEGCLHLLNTWFATRARKQAEKGSISSSLIVLPLVIRGVVFAAIAYFAYGNAATIANTITTLHTNFGFLAKGLLISSRLLVCLGLAIVLRNLSVKDHYGALLAGFGVSAFAFQSHPIALFLCGLVAFGAGAFAFYNAQTKSEVSATQTKKGSAEKWW